MNKVEFEGWADCIRLSNDTVETIVTTAVGPRIMRYGFIDGPNAFHVVPKDRGQVGGAEWRCFGGHRIWCAPEAKPRTYEIENGPVGTVEASANRVRVANPADPISGLAKEMVIDISAQGPAVRVTHKVFNQNMWPIELAPWALSVVAGGGFVALPQEPFVSHDDDLLPARPLVVWKFTDMADKRWRWGTRYVTLRQDNDMPAPQKAGAFVSEGWAAHITPRQAFIVLTDPPDGDSSEYPDCGSNFEIYTEGAFQELETLGPLHYLEPGQSAEHVEYWYLAAIKEIEDSDRSLDAVLMPVVERAWATVRASFS
jgi:hypothetical protein